MVFTRVKFIEHFKFWKQICEYDPYGPFIHVLTFI